MKLSFFRSRSDVTSPKKENKLRHMLSPGRSKSLTPNDLSKLSNSPPVHPEISIDSQSSGSLSGIVRSFDGAADSDPPSTLSEPDNTLSPPARNADNALGSDSSAMDERDMHRKLMDVESSFLPDPSPVTGARRSHSAENWAIFGSPSRSQADVGFQPKSNDEQSLSEAANTDEPSEPHRAQRRIARSPGLIQSATSRPRGTSDYLANLLDVDELDYGDSSFGSFSKDYTQSSPTAAAAERTKSRAISSLDSHVESSRPTFSPKTPASELSDSKADEETPKQSKRTVSQTNRPLERPTTPKSRAAPLGPQDSQSADDSRDIVAPLQTRSPQRGEIHAAGHSRQISSVSSMANRSEMSTDAPSEETIGADYALQTGGAVPPNASALQSSREISRVPSFGSIASSMSANTETASRKPHKRGLSDALKLPSDNNLGRLDEELKPQQGPSTPNQASAGPSDTVLAKHVRDIRVPNTVARDFRDTYQDTENKSTMSTPFTTRAKSSLTLKEQNSKVDKLSKENFDLKLKIHYLHQALQDRSDEGVKDLISKNAQLQADLVKSKKDNQALRRKLRDIERDQAMRGDGLSAPGYSNQDESEDDLSSRGFRHGQMEEEILYLRDRVQFLEEDNAKLRDEGLSREIEKRRLAEQVRVAQNRSIPGSPGHADEAAIWKDALQDETAKRHRSEREVDALRTELNKLRQDLKSMQDSRFQPNRGTLGHRELSSQVQSHLGLLNDSQDRNENGSISGTTIVEQLKQENAELRRDLGAQTSMLTSRNRERERLQQEIENLKLFHRRGDGGASTAGDSILDRSVSQAYHRPTSRASGATRESQISDLDREQWDRRYANLRDENTTLRLRNQDLQRDLDAINDGIEDLQALQSERDDALRLLEDVENQSEAFREDALNTINGLEELIEEREQEVANLARELDGREDESTALRQEIKAVSESLVRLADDREASQNQIQNLEQDLTNANGELEALEKALRELSATKERLEVQAESSQSEIAFLREEQEGDKIKIGDLESGLRSAKSNLKNGEDRFKEIEDLQAELSKSKEDARQLKTALSLREVESTNVKDRLEELENGLRATFGDFQGPRSTLLREVMKRQRDLENTSRDLDTAKYDLGEKQRLLKDRETLLEASGLETKRLCEEVEKERTARRQVQESHERALKNKDPVARAAELDIARAQDRKKLAALEQKYAEQLRDRNTLLLSLWTRLSSLCGTDWPRHEGASKDQSTAVESISTDLPAFHKNILQALSTIEGIIQSFPSRMRITEQALQKELHALDEALTTRTKRIERLEKTVKHSTNTGSSSDNNNNPTMTDVKSLKDENKSLRREIKHLKQGTWFALPGLAAPNINGVPSEAHRSGRSSRKEHRSRERRSGMTPSPSRTAAATTAVYPHLLAPSGRHYSSSALESKTSAAASAAAIALQQQKLAEHGGSATRQLDAIGGPSSTSASDTENARLVLQLKEMQRRLKAEREGRLLDRSGARKRLEEGKAENEELRRELDRARTNGSGEDSGVDAETRRSREEKNTAKRLSHLV